MSTMTMVHFACDVCEAIRNFTVSFLKETWRLCQVFGYARAAGELSRHGMYKEAKELMLYCSNPDKDER